MKGIHILLSVSASACCVSIGHASQVLVPLLFSSMESGTDTGASSMELELADLEFMEEIDEASESFSGDEIQSVSRGLSFFNSGIFSPFKKGGPSVLDGNTCTYDPSDFDSNLVGEYLGTPELLTADEVKLLEDAFLDSYNEVASGLCDEEFHTMSKITIFASELENTSNRYRELQRLAALNGNTISNEVRSRRFSLKIYAIGRCRGCKRETDLFDDAFRRLQYTKDTLSTGGVTLIDRRPIDNPSDGTKLVWKRSEYNCDCLAKKDLPSRPPGLDEFKNSYGKKVKALSNEGLLKSVTEALGISQVVEVECGGLQDTFTSEVVVDAEGDPENITPEEVTIMKDLFIQSYATSIESICDSLFRVAVGADLSIEESSRRLQTSSLASSTSGRRRPFRFRFKVTGKCMGCKSEDRLFDDAFRRSLADEFHFQPFVNVNHRDLGYIFNGKECYCVKNAPDRPPSNVEFGDIFSVNVVEASLPNVFYIGEVTQVDDTMPSASPSLSPTTQTPSMAPTEFPTLSPTDSPTDTPTVTESNMPSTPFPSARPSHSPSNPTVPTESPMPSPEPSGSPSERFL